MSDKDETGGADKSHDPTPKKLQTSREKGDVPYSSEATAAATYAGFFVILIVAASWTMTQLQDAMTSFLVHPTDIGAMLLAPSENGFFARLGARIAAATAPVFAILMAAAVASIMFQRAFTFAPSKIKPKLSRLSMISNAKQKYGPDGLSEFLKSAAKMSAVLAILLLAYKDRFTELPALAQLPASAIAPLLHREAIFFCGLVTAAAALIAAIDLPWRYFQHRNRLKMTYQEVKEENRETEGDPTLKSARRQRAESIATNRMMNDVPKADIVIVNPTHYAVALKWDRKAGKAPVCVAKGVDEIAARIRQTAATAGVPIKRDPPTARSIYAVVDIGREIRKEHYAAVAAAIHYADEMRKKWKRKNA